MRHVRYTDATHPIYRCVMSEFVPEFWPLLGKNAVCKQQIGYAYWRTTGLFSQGNFYLLLIGYPRILINTSVLPIDKHLAYNAVDDNCRSMADVIPFAILLLLPPEQLCRIVEFVFLHVRYLLNFKPYFQQVNSPTQPSERYAERMVCAMCTLSRSLVYMTKEMDMSADISRIWRCTLAHALQLGFTTTINLSFVLSAELCRAISGWIIVLTLGFKARSFWKVIGLSRPDSLFFRKCFSLSEETSALACIQKITQIVLTAIIEKRIRIENLHSKLFLMI